MQGYASRWPNEAQVECKSKTCVNLRVRLARALESGITFGEFLIHRTTLCYLQYNFKGKITQIAVGVRVLLNLLSFPYSKGKFGKWHITWGNWERWTSCVAWWSEGSNECTTNKVYLVKHFSREYPHGHPSPPKSSWLWSICNITSTQLPSCLYQTPLSFL